MAVNVCVVTQWGRKSPPTQVGSVVEGCLSDYTDGGQIEAAHDKVNNIATYLGELTELLVQKHVLSLEEINSILPKFYGSKMVEVSR